MPAKDASELFGPKTAESYDEYNSKFSAISDNLLFLIRLILQDLPSDARILCVGAGTGNEILNLADIFPEWRFTGIDPSGSMLDICRDRLEEKGILPRCELFNGYLSEYQGSDQFDAVLCLLVTQFVLDREVRQSMFDDMAERLKPDGYLINAEISDDVSSPQYRDIVEKWKTMHKHAGATEEQAANIEASLAEHVAVLPSASIEDMLRNSGFSMPIQFFQSLLIRAWYSQKS